MKPQWMLTGVLVFLAGADAKDDAARKELEKLKGTWILAAVESDRIEYAEQDTTSDARREWIIDGNKYTDGQVGPMYQKWEGFLRVDPTRNPRTLDMSKSKEFKAGEVFYLIYELDGVLLKTCSLNTKNHDSKKRPAEFKTKQRSGEGTVIAYWTRKS